MPIQSVSATRFQCRELEMHWSACLGVLLVGFGCGSHTALPVAPAPSMPREIEFRCAPAAAELLPANEVPLDFDQGSLRLTGTLTLPRRPPNARVPAIVVVPGSGALSRDGVMTGQLGLGFGFELPVYQSLAVELGVRGYAVFRYDKRNCGTFNDCATNHYPMVPYALEAGFYATSEYLLDAAAAVSAVAAQSTIDPRRVFVVGHSQGASLVPALLRMRPEVPAGVMLAPPFHPLDVLMEQQSARLFWALSRAGRPDEAVRERTVLSSAARALRHVASGTHLGEPILGEPPGVWASWIELSRTAPSLARTLDRPLLVLGGAYDYNVEPAEIEAWRTLLRASPRPLHRVRLLPCVTHALNCILEPDPTQIEPKDIEHRVSPELVGEIVRFLARV
ncbi:MAG: alpha/beta fold hydrolase [Polyangiaceae bacterium]|nr:alpha/beta fold hydrolase [Polyangiaceae bacterium]